MPSPENSTVSLREEYLTADFSLAALEPGTHLNDERLPGILRPLVRPHVHPGHFQFFSPKVPGQIRLSP